MLVSLVGGIADGRTFVVSDAAPPTLRIPIPTEITAFYSEDDSPITSAAHIGVAVYRLAYTLMDRRAYYVEEGVLERWNNVEYVVP